MSLLLSFIFIFDNHILYIQCVRITFTVMFVSCSCCMLFTRRKLSRWQEDEDDDDDDGDDDDGDAHETFLEVTLSYLRTNCS